MSDGRLRLLAVLAHPDDESLGLGGTLAHYGADPAVDTYVLSATRGDAGRFKTPDTEHPGREAVGRIREGELREACRVLGVEGVEVLGYPDGALCMADPTKVVRRIARHIRTVRPHVVVTFDPFGAYGHPDHIAVSQHAVAGVMEAAATLDPGVPDGPHAVSKLYYMAWGAEPWEVYQRAFKKLVSRVDGKEREARAWPDWSLTTEIDASEQWERVWRAVRCHETQMAQYGPLAELGEEDHRTLWGTQTFYRVFSRVNGGRERESDLFEGLR